MAAALLAEATAHPRRAGPGRHPRWPTCWRTWAPSARRRRRIHVEVEDKQLHAQYDRVRKMRASICVLGPLLAKRRQGPRGHARRLRHRLAAGGPAPSRPEGPGGRDRTGRAATSSPRAKRLKGAENVPGRGVRLDGPGHGQRHDGRHAGRGHDGHRVRRLRAGGARTWPTSSTPWAPRSPAHGTPRIIIEGVESLHGATHTRHPRPHRGRHVHGGRRHHQRRGHAGQRAAGPPDGRRRQARRDRRHRRAGQRRRGRLQSLAAWSRPT